MVENTVVLQPPRKGRTCVFGRVMGGFVERWLGIRICFPNRVYILVGDTDMFSPPMGGVCGAYAVASLHVLHVIHRNTVMLFEPGIYFGWGYGYVFATYGRRLWGVCCCAPTRVTCHTSKYGHVIRTGNIFRLGIQTFFPNGVYISVGDTEMFSEPGTRYPSKYECVFRTGYTLFIEIRPCFPNQVKA